MIRRGFVELLTCPAEDFLRWADYLIWWPKQTMRCTERIDPKKGINDRLEYDECLQHKDCPQCKGTLKVCRECSPTAQPIRKVTITTEPVYFHRDALWNWYEGVNTIFTGPKAAKKAYEERWPTVEFEMQWH